MALFLKGEFFRGSKTTDHIVNYILENLDVVLVDLHSGEIMVKVSWDFLLGEVYLF